MTTAPDLPHLLRADARDNRDRILEAARALFSASGLGVTMRAVARRAEVGPATLYRRFPTRQSLVDAAFAEEVHACRTLVEEGCADPDPWRGLVHVVEQGCLLGASNRGFVDAFTAAHPGTPALAEHRRALMGMLADLVGRAHAAGGLRPDVELDDLALVLRAARELARRPEPGRRAAAARFVALTLDAFRASGDHRPLPAWSGARPRP